MSTQRSVPDARAGGSDGTGRGALDGLRIADALELAVRDATPAVVLASATTDRREMAGHLAARLDAGLLIDAVDVDSSGVATQVVFGGSYTVHGDWRTVSHVVELEEQRVFGWVVVDPDGRFGDPAPDPAKPLATWRFELEPEGTGSRLRQVARIGPSRSGISLAVDRTPEREEAIVSFRLAELRTNIETTLLGIKALAEEER
ncbi:SRPBCC family protein [Streptomyces canus]|uniref:SRPBCC family protein n=1 Tax=Streptomyces canus TaxID=58343 RepID=UPI003404F0EE